MPRGHFDRSARKAKTRRALLDAAARVYAKRGFAGATLDDVAAEAGYTKGAVYAHFGSKENLLQALMQEYLAAEIAQQVALFDRSEVSWRRPLAGSDRFMAELEETPEAFRLLVEFWLLAQRDERVRERLVAGLAAVRQTFETFAAESAADSGSPIEPAVGRAFANVSLALSLGFGMTRTVDPGGVPPRLLGIAISEVIRALEGDPAARERYADA